MVKKLWMIMMTMEKHTWKNTVTAVRTNHHVTFSVKQCFYIDRLLRMCQVKPKWLLEAKIASYKLYDASFLSLILRNGWVKDDVSYN